MESQKEIPEELFYNKDDLDTIRKVYVKKAPYVNKNAAHQTKTTDGSAKRNIVRTGNSAATHKTGKKAGAGVQIDDGSQYEHYNETQDPNYDSEEDTDGKELLKTLARSGDNSPMKSYRREGGLALLLQDYKKEIDHIIGTHYLKSLEVSAAEIAHGMLSECNSRYEEKLHELVAEADVRTGEIAQLPIYEVIKRSIIKSFDYSNFTINNDSFMPTIGGGANRMEAVSLLLVELCASHDYDYSSQMEAGFDHIFEIINELNKDVPTCNTLLACYLTRCIVDEIVAPSYINSSLARCNDDAIDGVLDDPEESPDASLPPAPPDELDSPAATAKVLQDLQYTNHSLNSTSVQFSLYCKERNTHVRDVINKTRVHLSHDHYSAKLQHIWGVNTDESVEEDSPSSSTRELKLRIDALLMEYLDNCSVNSPSKGRSGSLTDDVSSQQDATYSPPSAAVLNATYAALKELGDHTLTYYAHELVKRGVSLVLLNYRCGNSPAQTQTGKDLSGATEMYMQANASALHLCLHLSLLMHFCMCGEDVQMAGHVDNPTGITAFAAALAPLPPPIISKTQYLAGLNKFFESIGEPAEEAASTASTSTLFYDVMLDAPFAPLLFNQLLLLSSPAQGGVHLLPDETKFAQLSASLAPYYK